ncbi:MAG: cytochrome c maturation protein CcmE [Anaerolineales bacterium]|nr:cytochrome c maturation protein CcmE [Anaerolineales bacterium]MCW5856491.1 cytochrome c maturation protein CcmE [Anaerolineales bacterium]
MSRSRNKFLFGGLIILAAVVYLIVSSTAAGAQFFFTVDELLADGPGAVGKPARVAGAVLGDTIVYDTETLTLSFTIVHTPGDTRLINDEGGLAAALDAAVADPTRNRLQVVYVGVKPDLLQHAAEAIVSGQIDESGVFHANELLLRCPTRYEEALPAQAQG